MQNILLAAIRQELHGRGEGLAISSSEFTSKQKEMLKKLYKVSETVAQTKLFDQLN